jgi:hypothetical protein
MKLTTHLHLVNVKFTLEQAMNSPEWERGVAVLFYTTSAVSVCGWLKFCIQPVYPFYRRRCGPQG